MFKRIMTYFSALLIGAALLVACGGNAQAADITFKADDGQTFGTQGVYKYELYANGGGYVKVTRTSGSEALYVATGSLPGRILQNLPQLVNVTGSNTYIDPSYFVRGGLCQNGVSRAALPDTAVVVEVSDNCSMATQMQGKAK